MRHRISVRTLGVMGACWLAVVLVCCVGGLAGAKEFHSEFPENVERVWVGRPYWANRLQDWRLKDGRIECITSGTDRNLALLTRQLADTPGAFSMSVRLGRMSEKAGHGWAGFSIGRKGRLAQWPDLADYRDNAVRGEGLRAGISMDGHLFIGSLFNPPAGAIGRSEWEVTHVDSFEKEAEAPEHAFDGDPSTIWHSKYGNEYPHEIQIDMGHQAKMEGLAYLPRQNLEVGRIKDFELYVSKDGENWGEPVLEDSFKESTNLQSFTFKPQTGRYLRLVAKSDHPGRPAAAIAELYVLSEKGSTPENRAKLPTDDVVLSLHGKQREDDCELTLTAKSPDGKELASITRVVKKEDAVGGLALVCEATKPSGEARGTRWTGGNCRFWFRDWTVSGSKVAGDDDQGFGPILWSAYTLSRGTLTMTAQMPPVGDDESREVRLEVEKDDGWHEVGRGEIDRHSRTATIRVQDWDDDQDWRYRLAYSLKQPGGGTKEYYWNGVVRYDPDVQRTIKVAGFTGNADYAWPNTDMVEDLKNVDPDFLFFSGDQVYENVNDYGVQRSPLDKACLDYLRKWYFFGWSFRDLLRDRPSVMIPDDHDVYQGNIFGEAGKKAEGGWIDGGYSMPVEWVNMVQRTQTSNLPAPYDPTPVKNDIEVYYTDILYGGVSFAVIEDRKFKTGPEGILPDEYVDRADHVTNPDFKPEMADVPRAKLLGDRQLKFLRDWAADWRGTDMKVLLSQTVFANAATHHGGRLDYLLADLDSNGWPQTGRNKALDAARRGFAFHLCGDQHLATLIHHGIEDWGDAVWSLAVPSVCNFYMRAWKPKSKGMPLGEDMPEYTGKYRDGFGNRISVWAATNPGDVSHDPAWLHDKKPGFGLLRLNKDKLQIKIDCWPRWADPTGPDTHQFKGWPKTIDMAENYGRDAVAYLPTIKVQGMEDPVVQVVKESGEILYTRRIRGTSFQPKVFAEGTYTVKAGHQATDRWKAASGLKTYAKPGAKEVIIDLR